ncbi:lysophospholipid acyltransferase family protein [Streptomyces sp. T-3]|nr:lysophospholipid acyltransferase family protein [Streptomyces sp. T-3]
MDRRDTRSPARLLENIGNDALDSLLGWLADDYFRIEISGMENVPESGSAIVVANHSGAWGLDGFLLHKVLSRGLHRPVCFYASKLVLKLPIFASYARYHGVITDDPTLGSAELAAGGVVALFPEGVSGVEKPFRQRYRLRPFSTGFAVTSVRTGAPVIPVSIVGAEEAYPKFGEIGCLARLFDLPYFPVTTVLPFPSKWFISFGEPIPAPAQAQSFAERAAAARQLCDETWFAVQGMVDRDRRKRATPFW